MILYVFCVPGTYTDVGFIFFYPLYGNPFIISLFTTGTWESMYILEWIMRKEADYIYNKSFFKAYTAGSLFVYLCHDLWITVIATLVIRPELKENNPNASGMSFYVALFIMILGVEVLSNLTYFFFVKLFKVCCAKKKKNREKKVISKE
mgnify:CR=1 FL=1